MFSFNYLFENQSYEFPIDKQIKNGTYDPSKREPGLEEPLADPTTILGGGFGAKAGWNLAKGTIINGIKQLQPTFGQKMIGGTVGAISGMTKDIIGDESAGQVEQMEKSIRGNYANNSNSNI